MSIKKQSTLSNQFSSGLAKTRDRLAAVFGVAREINFQFFNDLEEALILADVGVETTAYLINRLRQATTAEKIETLFQLKEHLISEITALFLAATNSRETFSLIHSVLLITGVNGVGKTTTVAKLAEIAQTEIGSTLLVAADTFRAAATEQLVIWGERLGIPVIHHQAGSDPAAVTFDGMAAANTRETGTILIDTAGRLHTKANLIEESKKIERIARQQAGDRRFYTILVLDATTGQNALNQARVFNKALQVNGLILTKLDGTAKGGIAVAIAHQLQIPIYYAGVGEKAADLKPFNAESFVRALFES